MKIPKCEHRFVIDPLFESGAVKMFFGNVGDVKEEMRYVCKDCGEVKYE